MQLKLNASQISLRRLLLASLVSVGLVAGGAAVGVTGVAASDLPVLSSSDETPGDELRFGPREAVPQLGCQADDKPETGLQGRVPPIDILSGRAGQGYNCNLEVVGNYVGASPIQAASSLDTYQNCAYYGISSTLGAGGTGTQVLDASDPQRPVATAILTTPAMLDPGESLRVNAKLGLLVATGYTNRYPEATGNAAWLDIYDISENCSHPRLLSSTDMTPAAGHEGWFSPDGKTYYMSTAYTEPKDPIPTLFPVDISDPAKPRLLASWGFDSMTHGGVTTEDGARTYACELGDPTLDAMMILDTKQVAKRHKAPQPQIIQKLPLEDNLWCQGAYRVTYDGQPHLIQFGERSGSLDFAGQECIHDDKNWANFGYPRIIDIADERAPKVVGRALLEVHLPQHCEEVKGEGAPVALGYSVHHCSPDRLYDPTILACASFHAGLRVFDIRDPRRMVEIGYYNPGVNLVMGTSARPVVRAERGEIWFLNDAKGFHVMKFKNGTWPFKGAEACPEYNDYYFAQYNPTSACPTANYTGIGRPAPVTPRFKK